MELRNVITFLRIVELKQFSKAADELGYAQSTVTAQIHQLENELGHPLFDRMNNQIALTEFGNSFLPLARKMYNTSLEMKALGSSPSEIVGKIRIGIVESVFYSDFLYNLPKFVKKYPKVSLEFSTGSTLDVQEMLLRNEVDMIVCIKPSIPDPKLVIDFSKSSNVIFVTNARNELDSSRLYSLEEISKQRLILTEPDSIYHRQLMNMFTAAGIDTNADQRIFLQSTHAIIEMLKQIGGVSFLPEYAVQSRIMKGTLRPLKVNVPDSTIRVITGYHKDKWIPSYMNDLLEIIRTQRWL
ncbi:MAG: LysR family transcriptional regulator [Candidatus Weimeria sp.]